MCDPAGDAVITSFHPLISFILLSLLVSLPFISVIRSSMDLTHVGGPSPSASKERKPGGVGGRRKYNDDKYTDGAHLIDSAKVFSEDAWDVVRKRWKVKKTNSLTTATNDGMCCKFLEM